MIRNALTSPNTDHVMRRFAPPVLFALLLAIAGCGKKPAPDPAPDTPNVKIDGPAADPASERTKKLAKLKSTNQEVRRNAIEDLCWDAEDDPAVLPALVEMLKDKGVGRSGFTSSREINSTREAAARTIMVSTNGEKVMREKGIPVLREELSNPSAVIREYTAFTIGQLGALAKLLAPDIQKLCTDPDANVRGVAFDTLRITGIADPIAFVKLLKSENEDIVRLAAELLPLITDMPEGAVPALADALSSTNTNVQAAAANGLAAAGPKAGSAAPQVAGAIKKYYPAEYNASAPRSETIEYAYWNALGKMGEAAVAPLLKLLDHTNVMVQSEALDTLAAIGPPAKSADDELKKRMAKRDATSLQAAHALIRIGESKDEAIALIKEALQLRNAAPIATQIVIRLGNDGKPLHATALANLSSPDAITRYRVLDLIATLAAAEATKVGADMGKLATDESDEVRKHLGTVLAKLGVSAAPAAEAIGKALPNEKDITVRDGFVEALIAMGAGAKPALPGLIPLLASKDLSVWLREKIIAAVTVADPASAEVSAALIQAAGDGEVNIRTAAANAIGKLNPLSPDALNTLVKLAKSDPRNTPRVAALRAMTSAGPRAKAARGELDAIAAGPQPGLSLWAKVALAATDGDVNKAAPEIRNGLAARNQQVRSSAAEAILLIGPTNADLPMLLKVMKDVSASTKIASAQAVGRLGAFAKDAVPQLTKLLEDNDVEVRIAAADALGQIGPASLPAVTKLKEVARQPDARASAQRALDKIGAK